MRSREPALLERLKELVEALKQYNVPVVANGDCWGTKDRKKICDITGASCTSNEYVN